MKALKTISLAILLSLTLFSCIKEKKDVVEKDDDITVEEPVDDPIPFAVGTWSFEKMHGVNDDGTPFDIKQRIAEYEKLLRQGGLSKEETDRITYLLPRLKSAFKSFVFEQFVIEEGGMGRVVYTNGAYGPFELTWTEEDASTFHIDYGGSYHLNYYFRLDSNLKTGYYMSRDWDPDGPNIKIYVKKGNK